MTDEQSEAADEALIDRSGDAPPVSESSAPRRLAAGGWRLAAGGWRLAAGGWRLAAGGWRLAAEHTHYRLGYDLGEEFARVTTNPTPLPEHHLTKHY
ncbi:hypothetical protein ABZX12_41170 [Kribbella sp. NPDC003505]|uniref:hypothetical protein n=1 Tax=Kribbella sp. NPDC003505 TaxID=3154448 RepID=UPI0033A39F2D